MKRQLAKLLGTTALFVPLLTATGAHAQEALTTAPATGPAIDPFAASIIGAIALAGAAIVYAMRVSAATRNQSVHWSERLAEMEARLEKADAVLSAHPGLVLVWEDDAESIENGWGEPKILGGPAALASLLSFSKSTDGESHSPVDRLLDTLGALPVDEDDAEETARLKDKVNDLRAHGVAFSGNVVTADGRSIEVDGRVAGGQVALWMTDPAVRMAEDGAIVGAVRERATDLHGSHALLERAPFPAWRRNADLALVWVNKTYVEAVEAANVGDVVKRQIELDNSVRKIASEAAAVRKQCEERVAVNAQGERRVFRIIESPLHGSGDAAMGGYAIDITELDKTKTDLRHHIDANRRTLDQIQTAVAIFGASQNLIYCNRSFQALWELDDADLGGRSYHGEILDQLRHKGKLPEPADYDEWKQEQLALYTDNLSAPGAERDGEAPDEVWHLPNGKILRVAKQRHPLGGLMVAFEDVTEKISLERQFNTQLKVQKATLNNLSEGIAVFGADGALKLYNKAFLKLWRLDDAFAAGNPHVDKTLDQFRTRLDGETESLTLLRNCITSKSPEFRTSQSGAEVVLSDGRTLAIGAEPLPDGATLAHFLDITDSKEREKALEDRNAILENADRLKSKFVDHVSYQLRTPLSTIVGFSEMLDGQMFGVLNDRQKDYIASILTASYHLRDLINDIIDLAAIDAGKMELNRQPVDLRELLENAATFAALKAEDTQIALKIDCPKDIGEANIDERRIKQVLFNLLSNAFTYTGAGGEVTMGAAKIDGAVKIWVRDSGRGLSAKDQAKVFDAFESRGPGAGAGLGLALVENFVKLHGGWVRMDTREGAGANIVCFLPEKDADADGDEDQVSDAKESATATPVKKSVKKKAAKPKSPTRKKRTARAPQAAE